MKPRWNDFCSYKLSMLGRQTLKYQITYERRRLLRKLWTSVIFFFLCVALTGFCYYETIIKISEYSEFFTEFSVVFIVAAFLSLIAFFLLLRHGFRYCLGKNSDLQNLKKGGFKVDTIYVAGAYHPSKSGWATAAFRVFLEGHRNYVLGTVSGNSVHAVNLSGELTDGTYRPCIVLDNGSVFLMPRTSVVAPKEQR